MLDLNEIRNNIDKIDSQLVELFEERMKLAKIVVLDTAGVSSMYANDN
jgi:chorismate mutase